MDGPPQVRCGRFALSCQQHDVMVCRSYRDPISLYFHDMQGLECMQGGGCPAIALQQAKDLIIPAASVQVELCAY